MAATPQTTTDKIAPSPMRLSGFPEAASPTSQSRTSRHGMSAYGVELPVTAQLLLPSGSHQRHAIRQTTLQALKFRLRRIRELRGARQPGRPRFAALPMTER